MRQPKVQICKVDEWFFRPYRTDNFLYLTLLGWTLVWRIR